jgi:hypothetical protein
MESLGINWGFLTVQMLVFCIYPVLSLFALLGLRKSRISGITQVLWALLIVAIPVLGALAFFILRPAESTSS